MKTLNVIFAIVAMFLSACGVDTSSCKTNPNSVACQPDTTPVAKTEDKGMGAAGNYFAFEGYVSPLNISVNNTSYVDSEDFYSHEVVRLRTEAAKSFPEYTLFFDATVGLKNFKNGMSVFLVASNDEGVASEAVVDGQGKFSFNLLADSVTKEDLYTVRASKRISVRMVKAGETDIRMCYNLYAEVSTTLTKSVILKKFATTPTEYNCEANAAANEGIQLPTVNKITDKAQAPVPVVAPATKPLTDKEVAAIEEEQAN